MATDLNCRNCKYWAADMDMDAFCMHPKAIEERGSFGATLVGPNNFRIKTCKFDLFKKYKGCCIMLTFLDFQRKNEKRCVEGFKHNLQDWSLMEWCGAATFEYGEAGNKAKKIKRVDQNIKGNKAGETRANLTEDMAKEICDGIIYGFLTISAAGYDVEDLIRKVFNDKSDEIGSDIKV